MATPSGKAPEGPKDKKLQELYSVMQSIESRLGGGEGVEGIYGSITQAGMAKILSAMQHSCGLDKSSTVVDIGAGLGRPLLHSLVQAGVKHTFGIELDTVKVAKAEAFLTQTLAEMSKRGVVQEGGVRRPDIICSSVEQVKTLDPATHAYSFWEGVPLSGKEAFGRLFKESKTLKAVTVVQRAIRGEPPERMMEDLGFGPLLLISQFKVSMSGSGRSFQAYVFSKVTPGSAALLAGLRSPAPAGAAQCAAASAAAAACEEPVQILSPAAVEAAVVGTSVGMQRGQRKRGRKSLEEQQAQQQQQQPEVLVLSDASDAEEGAGVAKRATKRRNTAATTAGVQKQVTAPAQATTTAAGEEGEAAGQRKASGRPTRGRQSSIAAYGQNRKAVAVGAAAATAAAKLASIMDASPAGYGLQGPQAGTRVSSRLAAKQAGLVNSPPVAAPVVAL